jgi:FkbM family methyltransferase
MRHQIGQILDHLAPQASARLRQVRDESRLKSVLTTTPLGFRFRGNQSMQDGSFEPVETAIIQHLLQSADCFVNIGANIGYYCCLALSRKVRTIAFEPLDVNVQLLQSNLAANGFEDNFELFPIGLSQRTGMMKIYGDGTGASMIPGWAGTSEHYFRYVPVNTLDNILQSRLGQRTLVLMDIEGAEYPALQGAAQVLALAGKPTWMVEVCVSEHQPAGTKINPHLKATFQLFWDAGYDAFTAECQPLPVTAEMIDHVVRSGVDSFKTHNFVFLEAGQRPNWTSS